MYDTSLFSWLIVGHHNLSLREDCSQYVQCLMEVKSVAYSVHTEQLLVCCFGQFVIPICNVCEINYLVEYNNNFSLLHGGSGGRGMATSLQLQPPGPFSFENPEGWPRWKRRFKQFHSASGLASASHERQTSTLLYCLGEEAEDVLQAAAD